MSVSVMGIRFGDAGPILATAIKSPLNPSVSDAAYHVATFGFEIFHLSCPVSKASASGETEDMGHSCCLIAGTYMTRN